ncbi:MAG: hypothetical protein ABR538_15130 [Candidatus Binatia bacterium]
MSMEKHWFRALCSLFLFFSFVSLDIIYEDAFIYFRLVEQFAAGYGYVFNQLGARVEYCSSVSWPLLLYLGKLLTSWPLVTVAKLLGIALALINLHLLFRLSTLLLAGAATRHLPVLLTVTYVPFVLWSQMGLETALYSVLLTALCISLLEKESQRFFPWMAVALILTRSEGLFFVGGLLALLAVCCPQRRPMLPRALVCTSLCVVLLTGFRFFYFHDLLPTPFYNKIGSTRFTLQQLHQQFLWSGIYLLLLLVLPALVNRHFWGTAQRCLAAVVALSLFWFAYAPDYGPFFRHATYAMPLLFVFVVTAFEFQVRRWQGSWKRLFHTGFVAYSVSAVSVHATEFTFGAKVENPLAENLMKFFRQPVGRSQFLLGRLFDPDNDEHLNGTASGVYGIGNNCDALVGRFVRDNYPAGSTIVYDQMGQTPYFAGPDRSFLDSWGLVDKKISHYKFRGNNRESAFYRFFLNTAEYASSRVFDEQWPATPSEALDYVFANKPDVIMLHGLILVNGALKQRLPSLIFDDPRLGERYRLRHTILFTHVYERTDSIPWTDEVIIPRGLTVNSTFTHQDLMRMYRQAAPE